MNLFLLQIDQQSKNVESYNSHLDVLTPDRLLDSHIKDRQDRAAKQTGQGSQADRTGQSYRHRNSYQIHPQTSPHYALEETGWQRTELHILCIRLCVLLCCFFSLAKSQVGDSWSRETETPQNMR